jgi:hypothetical protein
MFFWSTHYILKEVYNTKGQKKELGGEVQEVEHLPGSKFKPQYCQKRKKKQKERRTDDLYRFVI